MVIGASIAGLCAARVLSDFYSTVTVFERDELPEAPANRATVPQDRHLHMLMAPAGRRNSTACSPACCTTWWPRACPCLRTGRTVSTWAPPAMSSTGHTLRKEFTAYVPSRPHLEWQLRRRVLQLSNVQIVRRLVTEPQFERRQQRVVGVLLDSPGSGQDREREEFIAADLVVDAAGRGTRLPVWLTQWGYRRPAEDTVDIGISYASHQFRIPDGLIAEKVVVAGASHDQSLGLGMLCYEDGTWVLTTFGVADAKPPPTFDEMRALADKLLPARFTAALAQAQPIGCPAFHAFPASRWRRYDKLERFPRGIVPFGDAVASFNPTFGQGMTMTSLQAGHLRRALKARNSAMKGDLAAELNRATAKTTYPVWMMNAIGDISFHHATAEPLPRWWRPAGSLFDQFLGAAETDPVLAEWFLRRFSLLDSLYMVPSVPIIGRAIAHNLRLWLKEQRERRQPVTTRRSP